MNSLPTTLKELTIRIGHIIEPTPLCIETGASYTRLPEQSFNLPNTSTYNIVWHIAKPNDGMLWTYDNNPEHLDICANGLGSDVQYWRAIEGDSVTQLSHASFPQPIDFVHLDSGEGDPDHMLRELLAIEPFLSAKAIICCDDIHNPPSVKWHKAVPYLKNKTPWYLEVPTGLGTFMAFFNKESMTSFCEFERL